MELQFPFSPPNILVLLFFILILVRQWKKSKNQTQKLPPGPQKLPLIGNMHQLLRGTPHRLLRDLAVKYGPIMHLKFGEVPVYVISSPELAKEVLKTHDITFASRPEQLGSKIMLYDKADIAFSPYGDYWRQMRKICTLGLFSVKRVQSFSAIRDEQVMQLNASIRSSMGEPINLTEQILAFMRTILCRTALGNKFKDEDRLQVLMREAVAFLGGFDVSDLFPSLKFLHVLSGTKPTLIRLHREVDQILDNLIDELSRKNEKGESGEEYLIDVLVRLKETDGRDIGFPIANRNIKSIIVDMFTAGSETPASVVDWTMSELMKNPRVMEKAQAEVRKVLKGKKTISESDVQELSYLKLVIKESLRLHNPAPFLLPRLSSEQCQIDGYTIPTNSQVMVNVWSIGRDPKYWPDAEKFIPERFVDNYYDYNGTKFEYTPFGAGRRICPGMIFGLANVELVLTHLLYHFNWKLPDGVTPEDMEMFETGGAVARRTDNLYVIASSNAP